MSKHYLIYYSHINYLLLNVFKQKNKMTCYITIIMWCFINSLKIRIWLSVLHDTKQH